MELGAHLDKSLSLPPTFLKGERQLVAGQLLALVTAFAAAAELFEALLLLQRAAGQQFVAGCHRHQPGFLP